MGVENCSDKGNAAIQRLPRALRGGHGAQQQRGQQTLRLNKINNWKVNKHAKVQRRGKGHEMRRRERYAAEREQREATARRDMAQRVAYDGVIRVLVERMSAARAAEQAAQRQVVRLQREAQQREAQKRDLEQSLRQQHPARWELKGMHHVLEREAWRMRRDARAGQANRELQQKIKDLKAEKAQLKRWLRDGVRSGVRSGRHQQGARRDVPRDVTTDERDPSAKAIADAKGMMKIFPRGAGTVIPALLGVVEDAAVAKKVAEQRAESCSTAMKGAAAMIQVMLRERLRAALLAMRERYVWGCHAAVLSRLWSAQREVVQGRTTMKALRMRARRGAVFEMVRIAQAVSRDPLHSVLQRMRHNCSLDAALQVSPYGQQEEECRRLHQAMEQCRQDGYALTLRVRHMESRAMVRVARAVQIVRHTLLLRATVRRMWEAFDWEQSEDCCDHIEGRGAQPQTCDGGDATSSGRWRTFSSTLRTVVMTKSGERTVAEQCVRAKLALANAALMRQAVTMAYNNWWRTGAEYWCGWMSDQLEGMEEDLEHAYMRIDYLEMDRRRRTLYEESPQGGNMGDTGTGLGNSKDEADNEFNEEEDDDEEELNRRRRRREVWGDEEDEDEEDYEVEQADLMWEQIMNAPVESADDDVTQLHRLPAEYDDYMTRHVGRTSASRREAQDMRAEAADDGGRREGSTMQRREARCRGHTGQGNAGP